MANVKDLSDRYTSRMRIRYSLALIVGTPMLLTWLFAIMIARSRNRIDRCPSCQSDRVRPSWPKIIDNLLSVTALAAFRCEACMKRFYARKSLMYTRS
jgi:hypothetical protein